MDIGSVGEFGLIAGIRRRMQGKYPPEVRLGIGDDCAVLRPTGEVDWVVTTDTQVEEVHFRRDWLTPYQIGWRAIAVNLSDIAAMAAQPFGALAAFTLPAAIEVAFFEQMLDGVCDLGFRFDCPLIGGNLARDPSRLTLTFTVFGRVPRSRAVLRGGARPGDEIWVSGRVGGATAGLRTFLQPISLPDSVQETLRRRYAQPMPRIREAMFLRAAHGLTSLIDLSDGLAGDLGHICEESHVGARIVAAALPLECGVHEVAATVGEDPLDYALRGGEDFELCCTARPGALAPLVDEFRAQFGIELTHLGTVTQEPALRLVKADGSEIALSPHAFDHFQA
ncbi:MAG TPA: thiamine-phosphate kinase [Alphaproteobacteria bacterium]|nr:thiamine-phosphate kinase [Alphaproteobacteria bacterium]